MQTLKWKGSSLRDVVFLYSSIVPVNIAENFMLQKKKQLHPNANHFTI